MTWFSCLSKPVLQSRPNYINEKLVALVLGETRHCDMGSETKLLL